MLSKRNYKLTPSGDMWKVEMWNDYGMKCTVYENNVMDASEIIMDWWESSEEEFNKMNLLSKAIKECHEIDKKI
jgi:hypothetical protein